MEHRARPEARAGSGQHFHIITAALHAHRRSSEHTAAHTGTATIRSQRTWARARDPTTFNDSLAKSLGDVMSAHCNTCLWLFKWFIFIDCFCLVARQKIMMVVWIRLLLYPGIAKVNIHYYVIWMFGNGICDEKMSCQVCWASAFII